MVFWKVSANGVFPLKNGIRYSLRSIPKTHSILFYAIPIGKLRVRRNWSRPAKHTWGDKEK